jgi:hypothetical protein
MELNFDTFPAYILLAVKLSTWKMASYFFVFLLHELPRIEVL